MTHGPTTNWGADKASPYKARLGVYLFLAYCIVYAGFIIVNVMAPKLMGIVLFWGMNLAGVYGFGLIILAIIMGLVYNHMCYLKENAMNDGPKGDAS